MCPFCFDEYDHVKVLYVCVKCGQETKPGFFEKEPIKCKENGCGGLASVRKCPKCNEIIPGAILDVPNLPFSIVGVSSSGKTNYITVMLEELGKLSDLELSLSPQTDYTCDHQNENYKRIYEKHTIVEATEAGAEMPQIWRITNNKRGKNLLGERAVYTFTIFDGAGEDYETKLDPSSPVCRYINTSKAIILVIDPLMLRNIRRGGIVDPDVMSNSLAGKENEIKNVDDIINSLAEYIKIARGIGVRKALNIPIAVVLMKFDTLINHKSFGQQAVIKAKSLTIRDGKVDTAEIEEVDNEIRYWLKEIGEGRLINVLKSHFEEFYFFGVSSFGNPPKNKDTLPDDIHPHRVLDPMLWLFKKFEFID
jgi:DNA-directed RNA polymerase subunit RPC12/RpoP